MMFSSTSLARSSGATTTTLFTPPPPLVSSSLSRRRVKGIRGKKSEKTKKDALSFSLLLTRSSGCSGGDTSSKRRRKSATKTTVFRRFPSSSSSPRGGEKWRAKRPSSFSDEDDFEDDSVEGENVVEIELRSSHSEGTGTISDPKVRFSLEDDKDLFAIQQEDAYAQQTTAIPASTCQHIFGKESLD